MMKLLIETLTAAAIVATGLLFFPSTSYATDIYVYKTDDGTRLITDHPRNIDGYSLIKIYSDDDLWNPDESSKSDLPSPYSSKELKERKQPPLEPIKLIGIDLTMTLEQRQTVLASSGYQCSEIDSIISIHIGCEDGDKEIRLRESEIVYGCANFNACSLSLKELAQALVNQNIVPSLEFSTDRGIGLLPTTYDKYCGRGIAGELLCVVHTHGPSRSELYISVDRGMLGSDGPTFE